MPIIWRGRCLMSLSMAECSLGLCRYQSLLYHCVTAAGTCATGGQPQVQEGRQSHCQCTHEVYPLKQNMFITATFPKCAS